MPPKKRDDALPPPATPTDREAERTAHLDHGWDLLEQCDFAGARRAADEAERLEPEAPEPETLRGAIAQAEGDPSAALAHYRQAMAFDPSYLDPVLFAAEVLLDPSLRDADEAIRLSRQALDLADEEDEFLDATLLHAEALAAAGRTDAAVDALSDLPDVTFPAASHHLRAGFLLLDAGALDAAESHLRRALAVDADSADAHHGLAMLHDARGEAEQMVAESQRVRELDLAAPAPPWSLDADRFEAACRRAVAALPRRVQARLGEVVFTVEPVPSAELVAQGIDPRTALVLEPPAKGATARRVTVFRRNIERFAGAPELVEGEIRTALLGEASESLGLDERDLA